MSGITRPTQAVYQQRQSHTARNLAVIVVLLALVTAGFLAPLFTVTDISPSFFGVSYNVQVRGSLSYAVFRCGEVYYSYSGSIFGQQIASTNGYRWVCGQ